MKKIDLDIIEHQIHLSQIERFAHDAFNQAVKHDKKSYYNTALYIKLLEATSTLNQILDSFKSDEHKQLDNNLGL